MPIPLQAGRDRAAYFLFYHATRLKPVIFFLYHELDPFSQAIP
jgi:hypothetical protein